MKMILLLLITIAIFTSVKAQDFFLADNQLSSSFFNPSKAKLKVDFYYQNKYFIKEWNNKGASVTYKQTKSVFHFQFLRKGNRNFSNNAFKFLYYYKLSPKFSISIGNKTQTIQQIEYKTAIVPILPFLNLSVVPLNDYELNISTQTSVNSRIPDEFHLLLKRKLNNKLKLLIGSNLSVLNKLNIESGLVYQIKKKLDFELNINTSSSPISFAFRYKLNHQSLIISSVFHENIGPSLGVQLQFKI